MSGSRSACFWNGEEITGWLRTVLGFSRSVLTHLSDTPGDLRRTMSGSVQYMYERDGQRSRAYQNNTQMRVILCPYRGIGKLVCARQGRNDGSCVFFPELDVTLEERQERQSTFRHMYSLSTPTMIHEEFNNTVGKYFVGKGVFLLPYLLSKNKYIFLISLRDLFSSRSLGRESSCRELFLPPSISSIQSFANQDRISNHSISPPLPFCRVVVFNCFCRL